MKTILYLVLTIMIFAAVAFNASGSKQAKEPTDEPTSVQVAKSVASELTEGLKKVLTSLDKLKTVTGDSTGETDTVQTSAETLGETWDQIEKQVEEKYPEDYERIENSLYPLLAEAKKDTPNLTSVLQFLDATTSKIKIFMDKVGTTSS